MYLCIEQYLNCRDHTLMVIFGITLAHLYYSNEHKRNCLTIGRALWFHITEWNNVLDILGIVFTLLIIPPRVVNNDWQWVFAALAYIFQGLRIFKHAVMIE